MPKFNENQLEHIELMKLIAQEVSKNEPSVLKGGTALLLGYGLDRFSDDLDFNFPKEKIFDLKPYITKAAQSLGIKINSISIKKDTDTTKRYIVNYDSTFTKGDYSLKVECSMRYDIEEKEFTIIDGINIYKIEDLAKLKTDAFIGRVKARDTYDIAFLLNNYQNQINKETWDRIERHVNSKGIDELLREFEEEAKQDVSLGDFDATKIVLSLQEALDNRKKDI